MSFHFRYHSLDGAAPQYELDFMSDRDDVLNPEMAKLDAGALVLLLSLLLIMQVRRAEESPLPLNSRPAMLRLLLRCIKNMISTFPLVGTVAYEVEYKPKYKKSLREYCSILFLKPRYAGLMRPCEGFVLDEGRLPDTYYYLRRPLVI